MLKNKSKNRRWKPFKKAWIVLVLSFVLLSGCGKQEEKQVIALDLSYNYEPTATKNEVVVEEKILDLDWGGTYIRNVQLGRFVMDLYLPNDYDTLTIGGKYLCPVLFAFHGYSSSDKELGETEFAFTYNLTNDIYEPNCIIAILHKPMGKWEDAYSQHEILNFVDDVMTRYASGYKTGYIRPVWYYGFSQGAYDADYITNNTDRFDACVLGDGDAWQAISDIPFVYYMEAYENFIDEKDYITCTPENGYVCVNRNVQSLTIVDLGSRNWGNGPMTNHRGANYWMASEDSEHFSGEEYGITKFDEFHGCLTYLFDTLQYVDVYEEHHLSQG